ncbi:glycosyltransferase [Sphingobacterium griseoflavum]|uniref:Glycosyl transferase family 1 domain-containing protein n=1 Tax=Sphingobacterium griseoflavum TaxID=1474952 RepID=A0ABQ3I0Y9_9SPHI|nr:glycosyltransferase [Sphingobacterium griseoflavum]GHE39088.1 hypothetical protein GCM10017764_22860 [Sphingobacterium griseoflavum]
MKKKILLLTTIYPSPDMTLLNGTNVCHYFAKEWVKQGYEVRVIFNYPVYSKVVHKVADFFGRRAASIGQSYFITKRISEKKHYIMDGVSVLRIPLYKWLPKVAVKKPILYNQIELIKTELDQNQFRPDFIVAHFCYPHLEIVAKLGKFYNARTTIVNHIQSLPLHRYVGRNYKDYFKAIDVWGYRSESIKKDFETQFGTQNRSFICYSGVPKEFILDNPRSFRDKLSRYVYVGSLITRKYPLAVLRGILGAKSVNNFSLDYVGEGAERLKIEKFLSSSTEKANVKLWGNLRREDVLDKLDAAECFIMISRGETFGLVYLEAMSRGLIVIASRGEGMEGIIEDGVNGFFCEPGDHIQLAEVIDRINTLSSGEKATLSKNAIDTAHKFSDEKVAADYLEAIIN